MTENALGLMKPSGHFVRSASHFLLINSFEWKTLKFKTMSVQNWLPVSWFNAIQTTTSLNYNLISSSLQLSSILYAPLACCATYIALQYCICMPLLLYGFQRTDLNCTKVYTQHALIIKVNGVHNKQCSPNLQSHWCVTVSI